MDDLRRLEIIILLLMAMLWAAAYFTSWRDFRANLRPIGLLAVGLSSGQKTCLSSLRMGQMGVTPPGERPGPVTVSRTARDGEPTRPAYSGFLTPTPMDSSMSMGKGKTMVLDLSPAISVRVCR
ncbi:hypothetical protein MishRS11D_43780 (plasmid) [Methylomagnum ishizawai]|nr:hypothetical protein MishRS11D_43780 [Methylomagnum ishizawai]